MWVVFSFLFITESSSEEEEGLNPESRSYTPSIDLKRFHKFIHEAENKSRTGSERTAPDQSPLQSQGSPAFDSSTGRLSELSTIRPLSDTDQNEHTVESGSTPVPSSEEIRHTLAVPACGQRFASSQHPLHTSRKASGSVAAIHHQEAPHGRSECSTTSTGTQGKKGLLLISPSSLSLPPPLCLPIPSTPHSPAFSTPVPPTSLPLAPLLGPSHSLHSLSLLLSPFPVPPTSHPLLLPHPPSLLMNFRYLLKGAEHRQGSQLDTLEEVCLLRVSALNGL